MHDAETERACATLDKMMAARVMPAAKALELAEEIVRELKDRGVDFFGEPAAVAVVAGILSKN